MLSLSLEIHSIPRTSHLKNLFSLPEEEKFVVLLRSYPVLIYIRHESITADAVLPLTAGNYLAAYIFSLPYSFTYQTAAQPPLPNSFIFL